MDTVPAPVSGMIGKLPDYIQKQILGSLSPGDLRNYRQGVAEVEEGEKKLLRKAGAESVDRERREANLELLQSVLLRDIVWVYNMRGAAGMPGVRFRSIDAVFNWLKSNYPVDSSKGVDGKPGLRETMAEVVKQKIIEIYTTAMTRLDPDYRAEDDVAMQEWLSEADGYLDGLREYGFTFKHTIKVGPRLRTNVMLKHSTIIDMEYDEIIDLLKQRMGGWNLSGKFANAFVETWWTGAHDLRERIGDLKWAESAVTEILIDLLERLHPQRQHVKIMAKLNEMDVEQLIRLCAEVPQLQHAEEVAEDEERFRPDLFRKLWGDEEIKRIEMISFVREKVATDRETLLQLIQMEEKWREYGVEPLDIPLPIESLHRPIAKEKLIEMLYEVAGVNNLDEIKRRLNIDVKYSQMMYGIKPPFGWLRDERLHEPVRDVLLHYGGRVEKYKKFRKIKSSRRKIRKAKKTRKAKRTRKTRKTRKR